MGIPVDRRRQPTNGEIMPGQDHRRRKGRHRGAAAKANADLMSHVVSMAKLYREYLKQSRRILHLWVEQEGLLMPRYV